MTPAPSSADVRKIRQTISEHLDQAMCRDRGRALAELSKLNRLKKLSEKDRLRRLKAIADRLQGSVKQVRQREKALPKISYPPELPISSRSEDIIQAITNNRVVVVTGETGSGKTTQLPKMCLAAGRGRQGVIGCTQPRRVAAVTVSQRIAQEMDEPLGQSVGYRIRFKEKGGQAKNPFIRLMTDGILLAQAQQDRNLSEYDTIIVDEAHERSINIDFILGILKKLLDRRRDLKLVITSATIDTEKFSKAFGGAPIIEVSGRTWPVNIRYEPPQDQDGYVEAAAARVNRILSTAGGAGDILVFMPTEADIRETCDLIESKKHARTQVLPLYARLSGPHQARVFAPFDGTKVVVATNVAETSITIPGIRYVVDTGLARISRYSPKTRATSLPVSAISKSSADQRAGRSGRVRKGTCIRLFSEEDYQDRPLFTPPEILRANLAEVILRMISLGLGDPARFPFVDPPETRTLTDGYAVLQELGAIDEGRTGGRRQPVRLTQKGRAMARMPLDPRIGAILIESHKRGCLEEASVVAAALSVFDPRLRPPDAEAAADAAHKAFTDPTSDFATLLNLYRSFRGFLGDKPGAGRIKKFCKTHFLSFRRMREWMDVHNQIKDLLKEEGFSRPPEKKDKQEPLYARLHKSITAGYLSQIAMQKEKNVFLAPKGKEVMVFPGSGLFNKAGSWIVAAEMVATSRLFARQAANIDPAWLEELGGSLCRRTHSNPRFMARRGEVMADEKVTLFGLPIVEKRTVSFGPVHPDQATEIFIRQALVEEEMIEPVSFYLHNRSLVHKLRDMENRLRTREIMAPEEALAEFYEKRLSGVYSVATLKSLIKKKKSDDFLRLEMADIQAGKPDRAELSRFPKKIDTGAGRFPVRYRFSPGKVDDGMTVRVPSQLLGTVDPQALEWLVPGMLEDKVEALLRGLPKTYRRPLVPLKDAVRRIMNHLSTGSEDSLIFQLGRAVQKEYGINVPGTAWPMDSLPDHLRARIGVVGHDGQEVRAGRDLAALAREMAGVGASVSEKDLAAAKKKWEQNSLTQWDVGDLPDSVALGKGGPSKTYAFPALCPAAKGVDLKLFPDRRKAAQSHPKGVAALLELVLEKESFLARRALTPTKEEKPLARLAGGSADLAEALYQALQTWHMEKNVRKQADFQALARELSTSLVPHAAAKKRLALLVIAALKAAYGSVSLYQGRTPENPVTQAFFQSLTRQIKHLVPDNFLTLYDDARLEELPRYLSAVEKRAERGAVDLGKDNQKQQTVQKHSQRLQELAQSLTPETTPEKRHAVEEFFWMIEDFKVYIFAPELARTRPVSEKQLNKKYKELNLMR